MEAKEEKGNVVWYTSLSIPTGRAIVDRFQVRYPYLKVSVYRVSAKRILNRVVAEEKVGNFRFGAAPFKAAFYPAPQNARQMMARSITTKSGGISERQETQDDALGLKTFECLGKL